MPHITVLDQSTINKIAAGEVIERPSSVVKELLENAIDAQATAVTVEIRDGGISYIRVTDNGCGIPKEEVPLAFLRHSTSKIKSVEDLFTVSSLGFRGEALSSIASVAQVELITKTSEQLSGTRYQIEGGVERSYEEVGAPDGTTFLVRNLFYNTPARQKFLKTAQTEGSHVAALVEKIAMSHPDISIRFIQNNQNRLHTSGNHNLKDIIYTVFGREIAANLLPVESEQEVLQVHGFAGKPVIARSNRSFENYYINGRYVKSGLIGKAIEDAYKPYMMQHKYPFVLLHISIEPEYLDVNVHPTKMELRFRNGEQVYQMLFQAISQALSHKELIPQVDLVKREEEKALEEAQKRAPHPEPFEVKRQAAMVQKSDESRTMQPPIYKSEAVYGKIAESRAELEPEIQAAAPVESRKLEQKQQELEQKQQELEQKQQEQEQKQQEQEQKATGQAEQPQQLDLFEEKLLEPKNRIRHKLIGQLFDTYWLVEFNEHLYIIDQHAAHEKVLYEKTMQTLKTREFTSQMLNPPIILTIGSTEEVLLKKYMKYFQDIGFEIEPFGGREYAVRAVPDNLFSVAKKELLMEMIDDLSEDAGARTADMIHDRVATMSCKAAVKGNNHLSFAEADHLIDELLNLDNPYACPHGRPTIISMSRYELEKKFKRIV
jgi:DNA mismatch repair protein MutL